MRFAAGAAGAALAVLCSGCPDPNIYGTPRTTPPGKLSQVAAVQFGRYQFGDPKQDPDESEDTTTILPPTYQVRLGVLDTVDVGVHLALLSSLGADVKWNFVKTDSFDMAIDPGLQAWYSDSCSPGGRSRGQLFGYLPLVFGVNASDVVTLVPTAGIAYGCMSSPPTRFGSDAAAARGLVMRVGFGLDVRLTPRFGFHPELTYLRYLGLDSQPTLSWVALGLGFNFGSLPQR